MCIDLHQTGFIGKGSDHLQLIKFWPSHVPRKGVCSGAKFLAPPYYNQRTVFSFLQSTFFIHLCNFKTKTKTIIAKTKTAALKTKTTCKWSQGASRPRPLLPRPRLQPSRPRPPVSDLKAPQDQDQDHCCQDQDQYCSPQDQDHL